MRLPYLGDPCAHPEDKAIRSNLGVIVYDLVLAFKL